MRIAMITPGLLPVPAVNGGAVEVLIQRLIEGNESEKQYDIDVYSVQNEKLSGYHYKYTRIIEVKMSWITKGANAVVNKCYQVLGKKKWRTSYGRVVTLQLKRKKYDLIIIHNNIMTYRDIYELTENKDNLVYVLHNDIDINDPNHLIIANLIAKTAKKVIAISEYTKNKFASDTGCCNISVLYNCIKLDDYNAKINDDVLKTLRMKYGISENDFLFMFSGRIDIYKGVLELVQTFKKLPYENIKLLIVGKSWFDNADELDEYTNTLLEESKEIQDKIIFTGFIPCEKMPIYYAMANCLVIPSVWEEPFGVVALEGMASGLAMIVTNSGGLIEVVDSTCAIIVDKEKNIIDNLYKAMDTLYLSPELVCEMKNNSKKRIYSIPEFDSKNYYKNFCTKIGI